MFVWHVGESDFMSQQLSPSLQLYLLKAESIFVQALGHHLKKASGLGDEPEGFGHRV